MSMTPRATDPVPSRRSGRVTVRWPRAGMADERAWFSPSTSGCPALSHMLTSASYGANTPPTNKSSEDNEDPMRTSTVAMGRPAGPC